MRANPGGDIRPEEVVGRDRLIARVWTVLERQSIELSAERRLGKSSVIKKMTAEPPAKHVPIFRELEGVRSPLEFVETVFCDVETFLSRRQKQAVKLRKLVSELGGATIFGSKLPDYIRRDWKRLLNAVFADLEEGGDDTLVFFWDEIPYMLQNIKRELGEAVAREVLDVLRGLRQTYRRTRMVFTGSIGLHHVLDSLNVVEAVPHAPMNDMHRIDVPPLSLEDAAELALSLFEGEGLEGEDREAIARILAEQVDGNPYYVHHVVDELAYDGRPLTASAVRTVVESNISTPADPWNLRHYERRLRAYYGEDHHLARAILDRLARSQSPVGRQELILSLASQALEAGGSTRATPQDSSAKIVDMLGKLEMDHYLSRATDRSYSFRYSLVRRWWHQQLL